MTADEIRNQPITIHGAGFDDPQSLAVGCAGILQELTAQVATLNESRKPRWVNLSSTSEPCLVDATQVIGLSSGYVEDGSNGARPCVYVRLRAQEKPFAVFDMDHDEVRGKLGIDENWISPSISYCPPGYLTISRDEWESAIKVVDSARSVLGMLPDLKRNEVAEAVGDFDNYQMPF